MEVMVVTKKIKSRLRCFAYVIQKNELSYIWQAYSQDLRSGEQQEDHQNDGLIELDVLQTFLYTQPQRMAIDRYH